MKQLLQNMRDGQTQVAEVPVPAVRSGMALVRTAASLVSAGTERMLVEFAEKSLLGKARSRPDLVRQVLDKARREGILTTLEATFNRLDQPMPLGYSSAGTIIAVGAGMEGFRPGDRVACAGGGFAVHAEYALVPKNLLAKLPSQVDCDSAAFVTLGAIALHGFRLAQPQVGARVAVIGLGLLGLLASGIAHAAGCSVFGVDLSPQRVELAQQMGVTAVLRADAEETALAHTGGRGFDIVLICADARSDDPIQLAAQICRDRGHVIAVGAVGLNLQRKPFYDKEIHFQVSRSYGPGRYDPAYEERGLDYPAGYVRWTEGRNLEAMVDLMATGRLDVRPLISHRFPIERAPEAYELITGKLSQPFLGVLLTYPQTETLPPHPQKTLSSNTDLSNTGELGLGVLGAGNYATAVFLPAVKAAGGIRRVGVATASGLSARNAMHRFGFGYASSSEADLLNDPAVNVVAILTRHNHHARQVAAALRLGKHVFCEKPLAIDAAGLSEIESALAQSENAPRLMVGFNRRFAPFAIRLKDFLSARAEPLMAFYRVNAGYLPLTHWLHDPQVGGGRIIGEGCHFVDFLTYLVGTPPVAVSVEGLPDGARYREDNVTLRLRFADGSLGTILYLANGDKSFPKERVEVFCGGRAAALDDFRTLDLVRDGRHQVFQSRLRQDKGHRAGWEAFLRSLKPGSTAPIPLVDLFAVTRTTFAAMDSLRTGCEIDLTANASPNLAESTPRA
ncbi:MAG TPA: bi-domain-containing oxidoreductase [Anaerolineaceae bacterium]|nr:bi-domain-containing oxidoreductase [Anaerolineaceae bacterium]